MHSTTRTRAAALASALGLAAAWAGLGGAAPARAASVPTPDHIIVVIEENHAYDQIIGSSQAPYINSLASGGANLTNMTAETHPSQPNYYDLFSGDTQGITDDSCITPGFSSAANLGSELIAAGKTWTSYNETLPSQGSTVCTSGLYAQKHNPWFGFSNVPTSTADTFKQFPTDYSQLPPVSFVVPNLDDDMHDGTVQQGDTWLKNNLGAYATWAQTHNSLLVVTWDEDDDTTANQIPTVLYGQPVTPGSSSSTAYNHFDLLRTIEDMEGLPAAGASSSASDVTGIWTS
ncbi:alkaline phosphatase family protein [Streptomyces sp. RB6PN25]|uniref:phospholipase C n=1 Tax=Streptomyces humicola TaxID=2953240 RepID=A0ABT1PVD5_9ACTN|nr:alkaline phosphatase family protein [Streptomyces humicola]MCQ4081634.1 alkaline phosphatase family protein [Streptomyces humicola]